MATLDVNRLLEEMLAAAKTSFADQWPTAKDLSISSLKKLAVSFVEIEKMKLNGTITDEQARLLLSMDKNTFRIVLLSIEGLGLLAVENALNAALNIVRDTVNTAVGFVLL
jgi:hypothetical protein